MQYKQLEAERYLYFKQNKNEFGLGISWVDNLTMVAATKQETMLRVGELTREHFTLHNKWKLSKYVGCKIKWSKSKRAMKFTQPVLLQSYIGKFKLPKANSRTLAAAEELLCIDKKDVLICNKKQHFTKKGSESCST